MSRSHDFQPPPELSRPHQPDYGAGAPIDRAAVPANTDPEQTVRLPAGMGMELDFDSLYEKQQAAAENVDFALHQEIYQTLRGSSEDKRIEYEKFAAQKRREAAIPKLEAPQDTPEVDPHTVPMFAGGWGSSLSPDAPAGFGIIRYDPVAPTRYHRRNEYRAAAVEQEDRLTGQVYRLLKNRDFARTGEVPPADLPYEAGAEERFYDQVRDSLGLTDNRQKNVDTTLVRTDGYSLLALGIDTKGDNRGQLTFAAKGNLSQKELIRRARVVFPEVFKDIDKIGISEEPRQIIDLPPTPPQKDLNQQATILTRAENPSPTPAATPTLYRQEPSPHNPPPVDTDDFV